MPYWPLKSIVSTAPVAATSSTSAGAQVACASSLKRTPGERARRRRSGSIEGSLPRPSELTKRTGCGWSPSTSCSGRPAWRRARSSAADSNAHWRKRSAPSHSGGSGHSSSAATWSQKPASVHSPSSGNAGRVSCSAVPSSRNTEMSSPSPSTPTPTSRTCVVMRSNSYARTACKRSYSHASITSGSPASRGHSDSAFIAALPAFIATIVSVDGCGRVLRAPGRPVDLDRYALRVGSRVDQFKRNIRAGVGEQPRALADDHGDDQQGHLVDELVSEQPPDQSAAAVYLQLTRR